MNLNIVTPKTESKRSVDKQNKVGIELSATESVITSDSISSTIDEYARYTEEKDTSDKYRMIFTISPICSNVLFNQITEVVANEGDPDNVIYFGNEGPVGTLTTDIKDYMRYKGYDLRSTTVLNHSHMLSDTGYSSKKAGGVVYHCGYDIFTNHMLRRKEFGMINRMASDNEKKEKKNFNTLSDFTRSYSGKTVKNVKPIIKEEGSKRWVVTGETANISQHEYMYDTVMPFSRSITENLVEEDGWLGFLNPCGMKTYNYVTGTTVNPIKVALNKCMNANKAGEFIDMYPDRSLYSFLPKYNKYLNRLEYNWDYCITYPYRNFYDNKLIQETYTGDNLYVDGASSTGITLNGIRGTIIGNFFENISDNIADDVITNDIVYDEGDNILLRTDIKHNLSVGSTVKAWMIFTVNGKTEIFSTSSMSVLGIGNDGVGMDYYFTLSYGEFSGFIEQLKQEYSGNTVDLTIADVSFRFKKVVSGRPCKYYFRIFKKVPNFARTNVYNDNYVSDAEIEDNMDNGYNSTINKMAFERTIYNDNKVQIIYNDDINLRCLRDNLGRKLSEVYLTIVKKNVGYKKWYPTASDAEVNPKGKDIEFSHCFGKVTAGVDVPWYVDDYNVHKIHNISKNKIDELLNYGSISIPYSPANIGGEITINGDSSLIDGDTHKCEFFGDIVELTDINLNEVVLEDVFFRFNTAQRECEAFSIENTRINGIPTTTVSGEFANLKYEEITNDDLDVSGDFTVTSFFYNTQKECDIKGNLTKEIRFPANIRPEGYYYKAHYPVKVRKLSDVTNMGSHIRITLLEEPVKTGSNTVFIKTDKNYFIENTSIIYLYKKTNEHETETASVISVGGEDFTEVELCLHNVAPENINQYVLYKRNPITPDNVYELNDGTGRYCWRELEKEVNLTPDDELYNSMFTNGAYYKHENLNFFLLRQDPFAENGLMYSSEMGKASRVARMNIDGRFKDVSEKEYVKEEEGNKC